MFSVIHLDGSRPTRYGIRFDGESTIGQLKAQLAELSSLSIEQIGFFDVTSSTSLRRNISMDNDQTKLKQTSIRELLAYELPLNQSSDISDNKSIPKNPSASYIKAIHRRLERQERYLSPMTRHKIIFFGQPIIIPFNSEEKTTNEYIYRHVYKQLQRLLRKNNSVSNGFSRTHDSNDLIQENYPFTLKHVSEDGKKCSICTWNR